MWATAKLTRSGAALPHPSLAPANTCASSGRMAQTAMRWPPSRRGSSMAQWQRAVTPRAEVGGGGGSSSSSSTVAPADLKQRLQELDSLLVRLDHH
jgi:hypothetical protein